MAMSYNDIPNISENCKMSKTFPKFWICAVVDSESQGLYVKKQNSEHTKPQKMYFYLPNGLKPTEEILKVCNHNAKCLYTGDEREGSIINEIISYAVNVNSYGKKGVFEFIQKYAEQRGYQEVVDRYYEDDRSSPFKDFFESAATLKKHVLRNVRGKHHLAEGMAEEFKVLSPHQMTVDDFEYLESISDVLKIGVTSPRKRLLKSGPIADDFDHERIYRRTKLLENLKRLVSKNTVSMLIGKSATGKTVLVRQLAYELFTKDNWAVYYFNYDRERNVNWKKLIKEINSVRGIIVLENIHLAKWEFQRIYDKIKEDPNRHVLLTARPSFRENQDRQEVDLCEIEHVELIPFDGVDEIIHCFTSQHPEVAWSTEVRESIKNISTESFWLVSYALEGYVKANGKGKPYTWLREGVRGDLEELEKLETHYPEVLVALSPLYQNEFLTDEHFLIKVLRFEQRMLNALVDRGEITRQCDDDEGYVLYGLPHSALANLYWEYGKKYRRRKKLRDYKEFIHEYVISGANNSLRVVMCLDGNISSQLWPLLKANKRWLELVRNERSMWAICFFVNCFGQHLTWEPSVLKLFANKIMSSEDIRRSLGAWGSIYKFNKGRGNELSALLDIQKLAARLSKQKLGTIYFSLRNLIGMDVKIMKEFYDSLDFERILTLIHKERNVRFLFGTILTLFRTDSQIAWRFWRCLNKTQIINKCYECPVGEFGVCMLGLFCSEPRCAYRIWRLIDFKIIVERLVLEQDVDNICWCLGYLLCIDSKLLKSFYRELLTEEFAKRVERINELSKFVKLLDTLAEKAPQKAKMLCSFLNVTAIANKIKASENVSDKRESVDVLRKISPALVTQIQELLHEQ